MRDNNSLTRLKRCIAWWTVRAMRPHAYRFDLLRKLRSILYPDVVAYRDLDVAHHDIREDIAITPRPVETREAINMEFLRAVSDANSPVYNPPKKFAVRLRNVLYWPRFNLVLTDRRRPIKESTSTFMPISTAAWTERPFAKIRDISGVCTVFRSVHNNFYHTLIDNLTRLYFLHQPPYSNLPEIKLLLESKPTELETYLFERYLPRNVTVTQLDIRALWRPEDMILLSFMSRNTLTHIPTQVLDHLLPHLLPNRPRRKSRRLFISRPKNIRRTIRVIDNEAELAEALAAHGFEKVYLEDISFAEQISLFYDAEMVVGAHGAGLSNMIFSDSIDVFELHASPIIVPHYYCLSLSCGHRYHWWHGDRLHFDDNFRVDVDAVVRQLVSGPIRES